MMKEDENGKNNQNDFDLYNNIGNNINYNLNTQLMNFNNIYVNNKNINNFNQKNIFDDQQIDKNNVINTQNFFQIAINKSNENEKIFLNNFMNKIENFQNKKNNQKLKSQISIQDLNIINLIINDIPSQKKENNYHYLQMKILHNPIYANEILYPYLYPYMITLLNDQFGNYIYQSLLKY